MKDKQLLFAVLAQLEREKTVSIPQLALLLDVTEERLYEALRLLVYAYDSASIRLDLHDAYATLETYGTDRLLRLTAQEADALVDALMGAGFTQEDDLVQALLRTKTILDTSQNAAAPRTHVISDAGASFVAQELSQACEDPAHHLLEIAYCGVDDSAPQLRRIEPETLFSEKGRKYLLAYSVEAHGWRSFRLDRIIGVTRLKDTFEPRNDIPDTGTTIEQGAQTAVIRLSADVPLPQWRGLKTLKTDEDGSRIVRVPWTESTWLVRQIVSYMGGARPIEPDSLVQACTDYAESLLHTADMQDCTDFD